MEPLRRASWWPFFLVLLPLGGVLVLGVVGLWNAVRSAEGAARDESHRSALATARAIGAALHRESVLDALPPSCRFEVKSGRLAVPLSVGWIRQPTPEDPESQLPFAVQGLVSAARVAEFRDQRPVAEVATLYETAIEHAGLDDGSRGWVTLAAAWHAHRHEADEIRSRHLAMLTTSRPLEYRSVIAGTLLLCAAAGAKLPPWSTEGIGRLTSDQSRALVLRLREGNRLAEVGLLEKALQQARELRRALRLASDRIALLNETQTPLVTSAGGETLLFFPEAPAGGRGAILATEALVEALRNHARSAGIPWSGELVAGSPPSDDAIPVGTSMAVVPMGAETEKGWSHPTTLLALLAMLSGVLILGLWLSARAMWRERAAVRVRADFLTSVTHELKTPLSGIHLIAEMLQEGRVSEAREAEYFRNLAAESARLRMLLDNALDLGRIERGERGYDRRRVSLDDVVDEAVRLFRPLADRDGMDLSIEASCDTEVIADREALLQVFLNLMENARRYAASGETLRVETERDGGLVHVRFTDRGPGVEASQRERIFEKFQRGPGAAQRGNPGVGLGLYLSRSIVLAQGGDLGVEDPPNGTEPAVGACFVVTLPVEESS